MSKKRPKYLRKRGRTWYVRFSLDGKETMRSLGTGDEALARKKAKLMVEAAQERRFDVLEESKKVKGYARIGEILDAYQELAITRGVKTRTWKNYRSSLIKIITTATGGNGVRAMSADVLTRGLVDQYTRQMLSRVSDDETRRDRASRTIYSSLRQARSVFSKWALAAYKDRGLHLPDLDGFLKSNTIKHVAHTYRRPDEILIERTIEAGRALRETDTSLYLAFVLCFDVALRAGEAMACKWDWIRKQGDHYVVDVITRADFRPKGKERSVPISAEVYEHLCEGRIKGHPYVLRQASKTGRRELMLYDLAGWMRELGWSRDIYPKCSHELRKLQGSRWFTELGAEVAQSWLGHKDIATTCRFYASLSRSPAPLPMAV